jgi:hypothetical protein
MKGETRIMGARKMGGIGGWMKIRDEIRRRKRRLQGRRKCKFFG